MIYQTKGKWLSHRYLEFVYSFSPQQFPKSFGQLIFSGRLKMHRARTYPMILFKSVQRGSWEDHELSQRPDGVWWPALVKQEDGSLSETLQVIRREK